MACETHSSVPPSLHSANTGGSKNYTVKSTQVLLTLFFFVSRVSFEPAIPWITMRSAKKSPGKCRLYSPPPRFLFLARPFAWVQQNLQKLFHAFAEACSTTRVSRQRNGAIRHAALPSLFSSDSLCGVNGISAGYLSWEVFFFFSELEKLQRDCWWPRRRWWWHHRYLYSLIYRCEQCGTQRDCCHTACVR